jgi:mannose-6-phosphate isomerase-like protein (cupin superfamily)
VLYLAYSGEKKLKEVFETMSTQLGFDLFGTFIHIENEGAVPIEVTETFWKELASGERPELNDGWLMTAFHMAADSPTWEMHPAGDEVLYLLSGAMDVVLQAADSEQVIELRKGSGCIVPRGKWHRQIVREPSDLLGITFGKGTQHRLV